MQPQASTHAYQKLPAFWSERQCSTCSKFHARSNSLAAIRYCKYMLLYHAVQHVSLKIHVATLQRTPSFKERPNTTTVTVCHRVSVTSVRSTLATLVTQFWRRRRAPRPAESARAMTHHRAPRPRTLCVRVTIGQLNVSLFGQRAGR